MKENTFQYILFLFKLTCCFSFLHAHRAGRVAGSIQPLLDGGHIVRLQVGQVNGRSMAAGQNIKRLLVSLGPLKNPGSRGTSRTETSSNGFLGTRVPKDPVEL